MATLTTQHPLPYLHRNWVTAVSSLQTVGNKSPPSSADREEKRPKEEFDMGYFPRPTKRRRLADPPVESQQNSQLISPSEQGPRSHAQSPLDRADDLERGLRVEILKIEHKGSSRVKFNTAYSRVTDPIGGGEAKVAQARCRITILSRKHDTEYVLHSDSQICTLKSFKNPVGPSYMVRIYGSKPFMIPKEKLLIMREDDAVFDLADAYTLKVELESAGALDWPPLNVTSPASDALVFSQPSVPARHWILASTVSDIFGPSRIYAPVRLKKGPRCDVQTDFVMTVDARWTTGFSESMVKRRLEKGVLPSITVFDPNEKIPDEDDVRVNGVNGVNEINGINGHHAMSGINGESMALDDEDEEMDGELTPSRSLRTRGVDKVYNLKLLSDKAQGKERRRRRKMENWAKNGEGKGLIYYFPEEHFSVEGFVCCLCLAPTQSLAQLRAHFLSHPNFDFDVESHGGRLGHAVVVSHNADQAGTPLWPQTFQLGRATKSLELDKYVDGDDSWITSRYGPDNDILTKPKPAAVPQKLTARRKDKKLVVPKTKQPLFEFLSKAPLEPGSEIRPVVADDTWLIHKHRDTIQDFSDVDPAEKEYIKEWDAFVIRRRISSDAYIPRTLLAFVTEKAQWLVEAPYRTIEFGKHLSVLIARDVLDNQTISDAMAKLAEARSKVEDRAKDVQPATAPPKEAPYKSCKGCAVCGLPVLGPSLLICGNKGCTKRLYHDSCITKTAKMPVDDPGWLCNPCVAGRREENPEPGK